MRCSCREARRWPGCWRKIGTGCWWTKTRPGSYSGRPTDVGISVVVPVYNSETILPLLVERVRQVLDPDRGDLEMILVDDCSRDQSWAAIERLVKAHRWMRGFRLMRNCGQH